MINKSIYKAVRYGDKTIYFDSNFIFHDYFNHKRKTTRFPYYKNLIKFADENPDLEIYFTLDPRIQNFTREDNTVLINMDTYIKFCHSIESKTEGRTQAFLGQHLNLKDALTDKERDDFVVSNSNEITITKSLENLSTEEKERVLKILEGNKSAIRNPNAEQDPETTIKFITELSDAMKDSNVQSAFLKKLPQIQIVVLKENLKFIKENLDKEEMFFQNWIDEDKGKYRKQRCLIFGIEYIDPKREGEFSRKRFDVLAEQNHEHHILIELKSPTASIFDVKKVETKNEGLLTEYSLSKDVARAIPQVLGYKRWYENARPEEIQALGIEKKIISKCIIVIGQRLNDPVWKENFEELKANVNVDILTYTDLIDKLENIIKNLEQYL